MNATQIHLALNHIPVLLSITGGLILLFGLIKKNTPVMRTALILLVAAALFTLPVYLTGEGTEEAVEKLPGVSENIIERHEDMALLSLALIFLTGFIALVSFIYKSRVMISRKIAIVSLVIAFVSFGTFAQTAHLGGQIRHTELRSSVSQNAGSTETGLAEQNQNGEDD